MPPKKQDQNSTSGGKKKGGGKKKMDEFSFERPEPKTCGQIIWNPKEKTFLTRTFGSWLKVIIFFCFYYAGLLGYFFLMLFVLFQTIDYNYPKLQKEYSLIGTNPGMGYRPAPPEENTDSSLIWYRMDGENYDFWVQSLEHFLAEYTEPGASKNRVHCDFNFTRSEDKVCDVDVAHWGPCTPENLFNYDKGGPCVFLKINKIFNWEADYFNDTKGLPSYMPRDLKEHIADTKRRTPQALNTIWVSCEGESPADKENIGPVSYIPQRGFPGYYFPFRNQPGYVRPLVAVHFEKPKSNVLINIECKAWAKNIKHNRAEQQGSVHFELMIDS